MSFPIDLSSYKPVTLDPTNKSLTNEQREQLKHNIQLCRDTIVFFTAVAAAKGLGGHTGGPYDIVPEVLIADGFMKGSGDVVPHYFDEAGHRVAIQYLMSVLNGHMPAEKLLHYREGHEGLPGHPERGLTPGVTFSSGRLGHMWPFVNGVALANPDKSVVMFGSDGSQMEGNDAEAARLAVAKKINVKLFLDDNDVTISGHPTRYLPGYDLDQTLNGHGLHVLHGDGEDIDGQYERFVEALTTDGPIAVINRRKMAVGIEGWEGQFEAHDVIKPELAISYLEKRGGYEAAIDYLKNVTKSKHAVEYRGSSDETESNRNAFGKAVNAILAEMSEADRKAKVMVIDSDLEGSTGLSHIHKEHPEVYVHSGVMERGNYSAAAGFGYEQGKQGIFSTFSAFLEMVVSEATMARLNFCNVLCHFSHAGVDDMADNTCHFGLNNFFAANGLEENDNTRLYFPADAKQLFACVKAIFNDPGLRYVFSTRSKVPFILKEDGTTFFDENYSFISGKDDVIRQGSAGYVVSFGDTLYRALDAVERARQNGIDVGLINKATLNVCDEEALDHVGNTGFCLVVEPFNRQTGLGVRYGTWLLERGLSPKYAHLGTHKEGSGGLWEHVYHQGIDEKSILAKIEAMAK